MLISGRGGPTCRRVSGGRGHGGHGYDRGNNPGEKDNSSPNKNQNSTNNNYSKGSVNNNSAPYADLVLSSVPGPIRNFMMNPLTVKQLNRNGNTITPAIRPEPVPSSVPGPIRNYMMNPLPVKQLSTDGTTNNDGNQDNRKRKRSSTDSVWDERLQQLVVFKNEFNHTNVPQRYAKNKPLGSWVSSQRNQYKFIEEGKPCGLTKERIDLLNNLGFVWRLGQGRFTTSVWDERLQQLVDFNNEFNHTNVPQGYAKNKPLGTWINYQRIQKRLIEEGKPSHLTKERIDLLNNLGFVWRLGQGRHLARRRKY